MGIDNDFLYEKKRDRGEDMLTPDDIQKKMFSLGRKLENNDVGIFVKEVQINYQLVYDQVLEQEKQIKGMEKKLK